jgi:hypothetical protein
MVQQNAQRLSQIVEEILTSRGCSSRGCRLAAELDQAVRMFTREWERQTQRRARALALRFAPPGPPSTASTCAASW